MKTSREKIRQLAGMAVLVAIMLLLQMPAFAITIGPIRLNFALVPIVLGAILFGPAAGALLGAISGLIVIFLLIPIDPFSMMMFEKNPVITVLVCILKTSVAGLCSGFVWKAFMKRNKPVWGATVSAVLCPICNTGIFSLTVLAFFRDISMEFVESNNLGFSNVFGFVLIGLVGINFIVELVINLVLTPVILRVIKAVRTKS